MPPPIDASAAFGITYRPMVPEDLPFLEALYVSTRAEEVAQTGWPPEVQRGFLAQQFDAQHRHYQQTYTQAEWLVVERDGEPMGRLYLEEWQRELRIIDISLMPEHRGHGVGAAMLSDIIAGTDLTVSIHVEKFNPAMGLYRRLGFVTVEERGVYDLMERPGAKTDKS